MRKIKDVICSFQLIAVLSGLLGACAHVSDRGDCDNDESRWTIGLFRSPTDGMILALGRRAFLIFLEGGDSWSETWGDVERCGEVALLRPKDGSLLGIADEIEILPAANGEFHARVIRKRDPSMPDAIVISEIWYRYPHP